MTWECKQMVIYHSNTFITKMEDGLNDLTEEMRKARDENQFNEKYLNDMRLKLSKLETTLNQPKNITIREDSVAVVNKISVAILPLNKNLRPLEINRKNQKWKQNATTITGGDQKENRLNQLADPRNIYVDDDDQVIYIADRNNHRVLSWKCEAKKAQVIAGGNGQGTRTDQLSCPSDVVVDKQDDSIIIADQGNRRVMRWSRQNNTSRQVIISNVVCSGLATDQNGDLYVSDKDKHAVRRWTRGETYGTIVAGGNGQGGGLGQLKDPASIFVDEDYSVYVADFYNHRVMKWLKNAQEGIVVAGGNGLGNGITQLSHPYGVMVDQCGQVYVADSLNNRVMCWCKGATEGIVVVGGNGKGEKSNQLSFPAGLSFDHQGNLYVTDSSNHRIQKFEIEMN